VRPPRGFSLCLQTTCPRPFVASDRLVGRRGHRNGLLEVNSKIGQTGFLISNFKVTGQTLTVISGRTELKEQHPLHCRCKQTAACSPGLRFEKKNGSATRAIRRVLVGLSSTGETNQKYQRDFLTTSIRHPGRVYFWSSWRVKGTARRLQSKLRAFGNVVRWRGEKPR